MEVIWVRNITTIISRITKIKIISTVPIPSSSRKNDLKFFIKNIPFSPIDTPYRSFLSLEALYSHNRY